MKNLFYEASLGDWSNFGIFIIAFITVVIAISVYRSESANVTVELLEVKDCDAKYRITNYGGRPLLNVDFFFSKDQYKKIAFIPKSGHIDVKLPYFYKEARLMSKKNVLFTFQEKAITEKIYLSSKVRLKNRIFSFRRRLLEAKTSLKYTLYFILFLMKLKRTLNAFKRVSIPLKVLILYSRSTSIIQIEKTSYNNIEIIGSLTTKIPLYRLILILELLLGESVMADESNRDVDSYSGSFTLDKYKRYSISSSIIKYLFQSNSLSVDEVNSIVSKESNVKPRQVHSFQKHVELESWIEKFTVTFTTEEYPLSPTIGSYIKHKKGLFLMSKKKEDVRNFRFLKATQLLIIDNNRYFLLIDGVPAEPKIFLGHMSESVNVKECIAIIKTASKRL